MEKDQRDAFGPEILRLACERWELREPQLVSDAENLIFDCQSPLGRIALRLTHPQHREFRQLEGELEWLGYLRERKLNTVKAIPSKERQFIESIQSDDARWYACAFHWIEGGRIDSKDRPATPELISRWGELAGKLSAASRKMPLDVASSRPHWHELNSSLKALAKRFPEQSETLRSQIQNTRQEIAALPRNRDTYGLIHSDLHSGNVFVDEAGNPIALDFDDCCYHYFLQEFAMPIYYALLFRTNELESYAKTFFQTFFSSYRKYHDISSCEIAQIPLFFRLRDLDLQAISLLWDLPPESRWAQRMKEIEIHGNPLQKLPWQKWAEEVR